MMPRLMVSFGVSAAKIWREEKTAGRVAEASAPMRNVRRVHLLLKELDICGLLVLRRQCAGDRCGARDGAQWLCTVDCLNVE